MGAPVDLGPFLALFHIPDIHHRQAVKWAMRTKARLMGWLAWSEEPMNSNITLEEVWALFWETGRNPQEDLC
jgi:hypothetical protein